MAAALLLALVLAMRSSVQARDSVRPLPAVDVVAAVEPLGGFWAPRTGSDDDTAWPDETPSTEWSLDSATPGFLAESPSEFADSSRSHFRKVREPWRWQILPSGLIYRSYLAGAKEPRIGSAWTYERELGWIWDIALGGRVGIIRCGTEDSRRPEGWQVDIEGAGLPRLIQDRDWILMATDFRFGIPVTYGRGRYQTKMGYYHLSSHLGDEFMLIHPEAPRINYVRDAILWGNSYYWSDDVRLYAEAAYAAGNDGGAEPWEFQFGIDYSPDRPGRPAGAPFFAINSHLRQDITLGGNLVVQTGWQWKSAVAGQLFRMGMQYFAGKSDQFEFFNRYEEKIGLGIWYDF